MRVLVYGAGPLGSLFAARLLAAGHEVALLARGQRLESLRTKGVQLEDMKSGALTVARPRILSELKPDDPYDFILVIMRKSYARGILPVLAANEHSPNVLFLQNNFAGAREWVAALGAERVLLGFPTSAGYLEGDTVRVLAGSVLNKVTIPIGEVDGFTRLRTRLAAALLSSMEGYQVKIEKDIDAWLKTHVAILMPGIAPALFAAGLDRQRLAATPDLLILAARATREALAVLSTTGIPIIPRNYRRFQAMPEPLMVRFLQRLILADEMETALVGHARVAKDEIKMLADELRVYAEFSGIAIPAGDRLYPYLAGEPPLIPSGRSELKMDYTSLAAGVGAAAAVTAGLVGVFALLRWRKRA